VEDKDDWQSFYLRWECTGRMLEHLFLARIRYVPLSFVIPSYFLI
jgi:hypothetical protein